MRIRHGNHHHDLPDDEGEPIFEGDVVGIPMSDEFEQARHATGKAAAAMMIQVMMDQDMDLSPPHIMALVSAVGSLGFLIGTLWRDEFPDAKIPVPDIAREVEAPPERDPWSNEQEFRKFLKNLQGMN